MTDALVTPDLDTQVTLDVVDEGDTVGVRLSRLEQGSHPPTDLTEKWTHGDSTISPRSLGLTLAEAVALAHDGRIEIARTLNGTSATIMLAQVPEPRSPFLSSAPTPSVT